MSRSFNGFSYLGEVFAVYDTSAHSQPRQSAASQAVASSASQAPASSASHASGDSHPPLAGPASRAGDTLSDIPSGQAGVASSASHPPKDLFGSLCAQLSAYTPLSESGAWGVPTAPASSLSKCRFLGFLYYHPFFPLRLSHYLQPPRPPSFPCHIKLGALHHAVHAQLPPPKHMQARLLDLQEVRFTA